MATNVELTEQQQDEQEALVAKITAIFVMFFATALVGAIPFMLNKCFKWTTATEEEQPRTMRTIQCLLHFGGGVLLCTTFVHLLPEVEEICNLLVYCGRVPQLSFPLAETLMCAGFFLMYAIEECVHSCIHRRAKRELAEAEAAATSVTVTTAAAFERACSVRNSALQSETCTAISANTCTTTAASAREPPFDQLQIDACSCSTCYTLEASSENLVVPPKKPNSSHQHTTHKHAGHSHLPPSSAADAEATITASLRGLLLVLALSLHELFEGLSIGLEASASSVWLMAAAISVHKLVLAFCVGMELLMAHTRPCLAVLYMLTFSIVSPVGIAIGIGITAANEAADVGPSITSAVLQGIACGTLVYVVFYEILSTTHQGFATFGSLLVGFLLMFGLLQFGDGDGDDDADNVCGSAATPTGADSLRTRPLLLATLLGNAMPLR